MDKKNLILKIVLSVIGICVLVVCGIILSKSFISSSDGVIIVELIDLEGEIIKEEKIEFNIGDSLVTLIDNNFDNVKFDNGMLMEIENYVTPSDWSTFISVFVDGETSMVGISDIEFKNNTKISLVITEFIYDYN